MKRAILAAAALATAALPALAAGAGVDRADFRYTRTVTAPAGGPVSFEPDERFLGHARVGLGDLRVVDAEGGEVPWRRLPERVAAAQTVALLNAGRQGGAAVALLDLGRGRAVHDRIVLDVPDRNFVARVVVLGADRRSGPFTRLGATTIYDVSGAQHARSTVVLFAPTDFRFLSLRATGVSAIAGATVATAPARTRFVERRAVEATQRRDDRRTVITLDLGYPHVPLSELRLTSSTPRYDRPVEILASDDGTRFAEESYGRVFAFPGSTQGPLDAAVRARYLRIVISNGDDAPLRGLRVRAFDVSRALLLEGGHPGSYRLYYGSRRVSAPDYDFARLPASALGLKALQRGKLGAEKANASFQAPPDTRSFAEKHGWVVKAALALAAVVVAAAGLLALRRRA